MSLLPQQLAVTTARDGCCVASFTMASLVVCLYIEVAMGSGISQKNRRWKGLKVWGAEVPVVVAEVDPRHGVWGATPRR